MYDRIKKTSEKKQLKVAAKKGRCNQRLVDFFEGNCYHFFKEAEALEAFPIRLF